MRRIFLGSIAAAAAAAIALTTVGCGAVASALPIITQVVMAVQDAQQIVEAIDAYMEAWFKAHPDDAKEQKYSQLVGRVRLSLSTALRASKGAEKLSQQEVDAAFLDFRESYKELTVLLEDFGVLGEDGMLSGAPGATKLSVPEPMALTLKVE